MARKWFAPIAVAFVLILSAFAAQAAVLRVVVVDVSNAGAYVQEIEKGKALLKQAGSPAQIRVWRARFAGPNAGQFVVSVEYPDLQAFAADDKKIAANADYQAWLKGLDKVRKVLSDSYYEEAKP